MFKKINNYILILLFLAVLLVPLLLTRWESGGISEEENRNLAAFPSVIIDGRFNLSFTQEFETWFMDHLGLRQPMISANEKLMQKFFNRDLSTSDWKIGKTGDSIYATSDIIKDFARVNLRNEEAVAEIGESYQAVSDYLGEKGIQFYYVQCVDKHTIYPERFIPHVRQVGDVSKTDQVLNYLEENTTVNSVYCKYPMEAAKEQYDVFSHWGDATHWTDRGAYVSYLHMMEKINQMQDVPLKILQEEDYVKSYATYQSFDGQETEQIEVFAIADPKAQKTETAAMGKWSQDIRHSIWTNPEAENDKRLLLMGDSYFNDYLVDDIAESFREVWLVWGDYTEDLPEIVERYNPDVVIYECAERVDRSDSICALAEELQRTE